MSIIQETIPVTTTISAMEVQDVTMTPSGVATNVLPNMPINEEPLPFVLAENERMVGNVIHEGFVGQECSDWVSERPTIPIPTTKSQAVPTVTTAQEIVPNPNLVPLVVISDDEIPPLKDQIQNMHFRPRPVHTVKAKPNRSHDAPILRTMLAEEIELQPVLTDNQLVTLRERYMNRRQGILVRDLHTMQRVQRTPPVELYHINDMTARFIRQNQKEVAFQDTHKRIKLSFPSVVGDVEHFERQKFNRLAHVDPCVRQIAIFFDTARGYPYNNLPSGLNLSQRDYAARGLQLVTGAWVRVAQTAPRAHKIFVPKPPSATTSRYLMQQQIADLPTTYLTEFILWMLEYACIFPTDRSDVRYEILQCTFEERFNSNVVMISSWWDNCTNKISDCPLKYLQAYQGKQEYAVMHLQLCLNALLYFSSYQYRAAIIHEAAQLSGWHIGELCPVWGMPTTPYGLVCLQSNMSVKMIPRYVNVEIRNRPRPLDCRGQDVMLPFLRDRMDNGILGTPLRQQVQFHGFPYDEQVRMLRIIKNLRLNM